ncbi:Trp biosynthesis-associated membrane protein [Flexivirga sp. ID2601S]|uniref:Trp biosynthesis-associated membrane protein n=1 Tax=Flexivirga aerilata TaxID=1656889 RepID=A0A849AX30_9MICO|nr:Trp biosynthesis-associated membrane protein [Flexivirga aerilata]NNG41222.1 Trp biosynthesis-associated membrane protein [Flexivirga aerilata]
MLATKRTVLLSGVLAVALLLLANSRTWVEGSVSDAVVQSAHTTASGGKAAPAVLAATLVGAAAVLAAITTGRIARWIAAVIAVLAGVVAIVATLVVIRGPKGALRDSATSLTGHTGDQAVTAHLTFWPWVGLLGGVLLLLTGGLAVIGARAWSGLSSRYDAPAARKAATRSDWDLLSDGEDPTDRPSGSDTIEQPRSSD